MAEIGDINAMAAYAMKILEDEELLKRFKSNAAAHAKKFDISNIVPLYEKLYERFL
jgi:glycosyltransferase involved in cell wall biosynthesis